MRVFLLLSLLLASPLWAAPTFPELSGRVVDEAGLLTPAQTQSLTQALAGAEQNTSNQVVVVTLSDLQGYDIADYGYQLGRHWGIGSKDNDNGVLLIVAPNDRKVRIEVGYGLEGSLTDALASVIIQQEILPAFRQGQFYGGIQAGVTAILAAIKGEYAGTRQPRQKVSGLKALGILAVMIVLTFLLSFGGGGGRGGRRGGFMFLPMPMGGGGFGGGGFGGGGFGGGGGGFGGGGASGGW
ncbi:methanol dehydrogenase [Alcanivorax sp. P2S70]|uniref:TPM domain-containing protein n=1 Tax=Alcanivorax TaxID=59753 RepID=UPI0003B5112B|nr:TPM domain-containing protein [Alcanivorax sp. P2S70]ERP85420.1 methanol dehydrogenase [Alcanivorax sp. P2S70]MCG8394902.1 TPM domain-containing protein [Pseudomonadales bacterium]